MSSVDLTKPTYSNGGKHLTMTAVPVEAPTVVVETAVAAEKPTHVAFVDLGHSSFSMTVASYMTGKLYIKSAAFDRLLGGRDFDDVIGKKIAEAFHIASTGRPGPVLVDVAKSALQSMTTFRWPVIWWR